MKNGVSHDSRIALASDSALKSDSITILHHLALEVLHKLGRLAVGSRRLHFVFLHGCRETSSQNSAPLVKTGDKSTTSIEGGTEKGSRGG